MPNYVLLRLTNLQIQTSIWQPADTVITINNSPIFSQLNRTTNRSISHKFISDTRTMAINSTTTSTEICRTSTTIIINHTTRTPTSRTRLTFRIRWTTIRPLSARRQFIPVLELSPLVLRCLIRFTTRKGLTIRTR